MSKDENPLIYRFLPISHKKIVLCLLFLSSISFTNNAQAVEIPKTEEEFLARTAIMRAKEANLPPERFLALLWCESALKPNALNINKSGSRDVGIAQINDLHLPTLKQMGLSRLNPIDSINYAIYLIQMDGWRHYKASKSCWTQPKTIKQVYKLLALDG